MRTIESKCRRHFFLSSVHFSRLMSRDWLKTAIVVFLKLNVGKAKTRKIGKSPGVHLGKMGTGYVRAIRGTFFHTSKVSQRVTNS